jgi:hypothetical protein
MKQYLENDAAGRHATTEPNVSTVDRSLANCYPTEDGRPGVDLTNHIRSIHESLEKTELTRFQALVQGFSFTIEWPDGLGNGIHVERNWPTSRGGDVAERAATRR